MAGQSDNAAPCFAVKVEDDDSGDNIHTADTGSLYLVTEIQKYEQNIEADDATDDTNDFCRSDLCMPKYHATEESSVQETSYQSNDTMCDLEQNYADANLTVKMESVDNITYVGSACNVSEIQRHEPNTDEDGLVDESCVQDISYMNTDTTCSLCGMIFVKQKALYTHIRNRHSNEPCSLCRSIVLSKDFFKIHKPTCPVGTTCEICGVMYKGLRQHIIRNHTALHKRHACSICSMRFLRAHQLTIHLRNHTGQKPFQCDTCGRRFTNKNSLAVHQFTHASIPQFQCDICGKRTTYSHQMKRHRKSHPNADRHSYKLSSTSVVPETSENPCHPNPVDIEDIKSDSKNSPKENGIP